MGQKKRRRFKSRDGKCDVWELEDGTFEGTIGALGFGGLKLSDDFLDDLEYLCSEEEQDSYWALYPEEFGGEPDPEEYGLLGERPERIYTVVIPETRARVLVPIGEKNVFINVRWGEDLDAVMNYVTEELERRGWWPSE